MPALPDLPGTLTAAASEPFRELSESYDETRWRHFQQNSFPPSAAYPPLVSASAIATCSRTAAAMQNDADADVAMPAAASSSVPHATVTPPVATLASISFSVDHAAAAAVDSTAAAVSSAKRTADSQPDAEEPQSKRGQ